jgi:diketogulonate reductase-like aldo/keto reductase
MTLGIRTRLALNDGREIPVLGLGVWQTAGGRVCEAAVLAALEAGYRHIDTAAIYGNEESVGAALRRSGIPREDIFVTTKLWNAHHADPERAFRGSLKRLGLDYVDLYLIHYPVKERNESWRILERLQGAGAARSIGVSNFTIRHLEQLQARSGQAPSVNQVEFHPFLYQKGLLEYCRSKDIVVEAYSPLTHAKRLGDRRLREIGGRYSKSPAQVLIRWGLQHDMVSLPKSARAGRIVENANVFDFEISDADMGVLDSMNEDLRTCWDPTNAD